VLEEYCRLNLYLFRVINLITGGAGFIGTNLVQRLLDRHERVVCIDNFSVYSYQIPSGWANSKVVLLKADLSKWSVELNHQVTQLIGSEEVKIWHLSANSDIRASSSNPEPDYRDTLGTSLTVQMLTSNSLNVVEILFASSSAVYGDHLGIPVSELELSLNPISNYGVMKLASEKLLLNCASENGIRLRIFRFPNVIGTPLTHGIMHDMFNKLRSQPSEVSVLGNGYQKKPYLHVEDLISCMFAADQLQGKIEILNISPADHGCEIRYIVESMVNRISPHTKIIYGDSVGGWAGDVPIYSLNVDKLNKIMDIKRLTSKTAIDRVIDELVS